MFHKIEKKIGKTHILVLFLFLVSIIDILSFAFSYHVTLPITDIQKIPELYPKTAAQTRIMAYPNTNTPWYAYMSSYGWKNPKDYLYFFNGGQPNYSIIHGVSNLSVYAGYLPKKQQTLLSLSVETSMFDSPGKTATISALSLHTLQLHNTGILISPYTFTNSETTLVKETHPKNDAIAPFYVYELSGVKPQYYLTTRYKKVQYIEEFVKEAEKSDALTNYDAFITTTKDLPVSMQTGTITLKDISSTQKTFSITTPSDTFFVASLYLYPGWTAHLDGKKTTINPANVSGMAIFVPKGTHTLTLQFIPMSLYLGLAVGAVTLLLYLGIITLSFRHSS
jgi:hypothetical protein